MTTDTASDWKVGQTVYIHRSQRYQRSGEATITKIGRRWAYRDAPSGERFDVKTGYVDSGGYAFSSKVFPSREVWYEAAARQHAWMHLTRGMNRVFHPPPGVDLADIQRTAALFDIPLPDMEIPDDH